MQHEADFEQEIWQPWKAVRREEIDDEFETDCLDLLYDDDEDGLRYGGFDPPRGLGAEHAVADDYLIL